MIKYLLFATLLTLSNCGFEAMYQGDRVSEKTNSYSEELASIEIKEVKSRLDQQFKNNLLDVLNPDEIDVKKKYLLEFKITKNTSPTFVNNTGASGRDKITIITTYTLKDLDGAEVVSSGTDTVSEDYNIDENRFGSYVAEEYSAQSLVRAAAQNVRNILISDLHISKYSSN